MASRMLSAALLQRTTNIRSQINYCQAQNIFKRYLYPSQHHVLMMRWLHVKVYDKDIIPQREIDSVKESRILNVAPVHDSISEIAPNHAKQIGDGIEEQDESMFSVENADVFGNAKITDTIDSGDLAEEDFIRNQPRHVRKLRTKEYANLIKEHMNAHRLKEAINVLEQRMLKEDRAKPENYIYNLLISGCAKAGYTRKAFSLFTRMRQRGLKVTGGTYTSLFNACANAPSARDGLERANHLRQILLEKGFEPNVKTYNVMIKAYGRCGDVKTAYLIADEMMDKQMAVNTDTFNFLLQACASDKEHGFRHCLITWHKMLDRGIKPDYYTFHTVLRCVRDCGFGDLQDMHQVLSQILKKNQTLQLNYDTQQNTSQVKVIEDNKLLANNDVMIESTETENENANNILKISDKVTQLEVPNLLNSQPHLGSLVELSQIVHSHDRFLLLGGIAGFLEIMKQNCVTPNIEAFTTMLEVIPPTCAAEKQILSFIKKIGLKADVDFFNILIKKRSMRFDYDGAKEVLNMIHTARLQPDIVTYGVLSLGCTNQEAARELLQLMHSNGVRLNIQILGAMLRQGCAQNSFPYVIEILQISLDENIKPNEIFLQHLHKFYTQCARAIDARHPKTKSQSYKKGHAKFCDKLRLYYEEQGISGLKLEDAIKKIRQRPYEQYKEESIDGMEPEKNEKLAKKHKLRKYIKKIKIENQKDELETATIAPSQYTQRKIE